MSLIPQEDRDYAHEEYMAKERELAALREKVATLERDNAAKDSRIAESQRQEPVGIVHTSNTGLYCLRDADGILDGDLLYAAPIIQHTQEEAVVQARAEERERLLFVLNNDAFLTHKTADHGAKTYQLWMQDADEDYHVLHDKNEFFATPLEAVDAAIRARKD